MRLLASKKIKTKATFTFDLQTVLWQSGLDDFIFLTGANCGFRHTQAACQSSSRAVCKRFSAQSVRFKIFAHFFCSSRCSELPAAAARPEPARHHHEVRRHGQEGDQQTDEAEGEEERVDERSLWRGESLQDEKTQQDDGKVEESEEKGAGEFKKSSCCPGLCTLFWFSQFHFSHTHLNLITHKVLFCFWINLPCMLPPNEGDHTWKCPSQTASFCFLDQLCFAWRRRCFQSRSLYLDYWAVCVALLPHFNLSDSNDFFFWGGGD